MRALASLGLALLLASCASTPSASGNPEAAHDGGRGAAARLALFISPAGEPFHGTPDKPYPVGQWFARADADHDGRLTMAEFKADADAFFQALDTDHNGVLDGFEIQRYEEQIAPEILPRVSDLRAGEGMDLSLDGGKGRRPSDGPARTPEPRAGDRRGEGAALFGLLNDPEPLLAADTDFDGKITRAEFDAATARRFRLLDVSGAGFLTLADLPKPRAENAFERAVKRLKGAPPAPPRRTPPPP